MNALQYNDKILHTPFKLDGIADNSKYISAVFRKGFGIQIPNGSAEEIIDKLKKNNSFSHWISLNNDSQRAKNEANAGNAVLAVSNTEIAIVIAGQNLQTNEIIVSCVKDSKLKYGFRISELCPNIDIDRIEYFYFDPSHGLPND